jgi:gas vesicle protein
MEEQNKKKSFFGLGVIFGSIIGGLTALFLSPKSGKQNRKAVVSLIKKLKRLIEEKNLDEEVKKIFDEATEEVKKFYLRAKEAVIAKLSEIKEKIKEIDKEKYLKLVAEVVNELKKEKKFAESVLEKLENQLKNDWEKASE